MEDLIIITNLNDFIFCPASIYFHKLYGSEDRLMFQSKPQIDGTKAHEKIDNGQYSSQKSIITAIDVYSEKYGIIGKIDMYDESKKLLVERKKHITKIYDGYIFQLYAQYYAMSEMGYEINKLEIRSMDDNKKYSIKLPEQDAVMNQKFEGIISKMRTFDLEGFEQTNTEKCKHCIYEDACDRSLYRGEDEC